MRSSLRQLGAAPARAAATIMALGLALAALGVFAVPTVSTATLHRAAATDQMAHVTAPTTPLQDLAPVAGLASVETIEGRIHKRVETTAGGSVPLVGLDFDAQEIDLVSADRGRLPVRPFEALAHADLADLGDEMIVGGRSLDVVGIGSTAARAETPTVFVASETATELTGLAAPNLVLLRISDTSEEGLDRAVAELRQVVRAEGGALTAFPDTRAEGTHTIDEDLSTISYMIGGLGIVAGIVALILLASTTNTLISERTREAAVMRALGARRRPLRRRLRRVAITMALLGALVGIPLGIILSNVIARMVLVKFLGITPGLAVSWPVVIGSALFVLIGARLAAGQAARRVTRIPLADALRDHEGAPFGRRWSDRTLARAPFGSLFGRIAILNAARRRARSFAVVAQAAAAVAAVVIVASMITSVSSFDRAEVEVWNWETMTMPADPGLPYDAGVDRVGGFESAIYADSEMDEWEVEVFGVEPDTVMVDSTVSAGSWLSAEPRGEHPQAVMTAGFAEFESIAVGDTIQVDLASGTSTFEVVGTHPHRSRSIFVDRDQLSVTMGAPGSANIIWSSGAAPALDEASVNDTVTQEEAAAEERAARAAIIYIFAAIGIVVVGVAAVSLSSTLLVNLHERRHELAALRAAGARRSQLRVILAIETLPLVLFGWALGLAAGWLAGAALIAMFEAADAIHIGYVFARAAVPTTALGIVLGALLLAGLATRSSARRSPAAVLRTTA